ncbi:S49 family peptidase [Halorhabdus amylolytica]|uniref:S49 family peptidase n=1 Tax=Halorhabdus amylolytica TaxID=2559573 RepID=UPI0010AA4E6F|nr:S49 family peptidase [Halorhabdus amylolytica]
MSTDTDATGRSLATYGIVVVAAVLIGTVLAPYAWGVLADDGPSNAVAVVDISGSITTDYVDSLRDTLRDVRSNESIKAVVLRVDSPGGSAAASESLYMAVDKTAQEMPVVATVDGVSASGSYYGIVPSDRIFVKPASMVGSVGVYATVPTTIPDGYVRSGPDKGTRGTVDDVRHTVEQLKRAFLDTVYAHRGGTISLDREQLAYGNVYTGTESVSNGLADEIGSRDSAIASAAEQAGLDQYAIVERETQQTGIILLSQSNGTTTVRTRNDPFGYRGVETTNYLMLWGQPANASGQEVIGR